MSALLVLLLLLGAAPSQPSTATQDAPPAQVAPTSNAEMRAIFEADQTARKDVGKIVPGELWLADKQRRERTHQLLKSGLLRTGDDYYRAAFIFQHGATPEDYILAHALAVAALAEGRKDARWIAAATLDRYLQELHQPQIFGTQYSTTLDGVTTQSPYNRDLVPDALRKVMNVPDLAAQEARRSSIEARQAGRPGKP